MRKSASLFSLPLGVVSRAKKLDTNKTPVRSIAHITHYPSPITDYPTAVPHLPQPYLRFSVLT